MNKMDLSSSSLQPDIKNLQYLPCQKHADLDISLTSVCAKQECQQKLQIGCTECIQFDHTEKNHSFSDVVNFKKLLQKIKELSQKISTCDIYNQQLKPFRDQSEVVKKQIFNALDDLKTQIGQFFDHFVQYIGVEEDYIKQQQQQVEQLKRFSAQILQATQKDQIDDLLQNIQQNIKIETKNDKELKIDLQCAEQEQTKSKDIIDLKQSKCQKSLQVLENYKQQIQKLRDSIKCLKLDQNQDVIQIPKLKFSQALKSDSIKVIDDVLAIKQSTNGYDFILIDQPLQMNVSYSWTVQIEKKVNWIGLGVCHPEIILKNQYKFIHNTIGNGYYLISANGCTWSHSQQNEHGQSGSSFIFDTGDKINIHFMPEKKKISFNKNGTQTTVELQLDQTRVDYQPCVILNYEGDSVKLV